MPSSPSDFSASHKPPQGHAWLYNGGGGGGVLNTQLCLGNCVTPLSRALQRPGLERFPAESPLAGICTRKTAFGGGGHPSLLSLPLPVLLSCLTPTSPGEGTDGSPNAPLPPAAWCVLGLQPPKQTPSPNCPQREPDIRGPQKPLLWGTCATLSQGSAHGSTWEPREQKRPAATCLSAITITRTMREV